jgi:uncharacterized protein YcaQ
VRRGEGWSAQEARWLAITAQRLGRRPTAATISRRHLRSLIDAIGVVQLDAINVVARTQLLVLFSRLGAYEPARFHAMAGPGGELFEYWGHMASVQPAIHQPLFRWRMASGPYVGGPVYAARMAAWYEAHASYVAAVLREVADHGPLTAGQLSDPRRRDGEWWNRRSVGRQALEWLFARGEVAGWRTPSFERLYDLPERVLPADVVAAPTPPRDEAQRQLLLLAARALGVGTVRDLADYYRIGIKEARPRLQELVEAGAIVRVAVEGWSEPGYSVPDGRPRRPTAEVATLLSPFDSLIWERARTSRLFGFDYRIEVYTPEPARQYGYFVLPVLFIDRLVGRLDLKADRNASILRVRAAHGELDTDATEIAPAVARELDQLRAWLGLADTAVDPVGSLSGALARAVR